MINPAPIHPDRLIRDLNDLAAYGGISGKGVSRTAFSLPMQHAIQWLLQRMQEAGLKTRIDAVGNIIGRLGPEGVPAIVCGSHIDSVPGGGKLDGTLGVLAGIECARQLAPRSMALPLAFEVIAFADEEGAYISLLGSHAMMGKISLDQIAKACDRSGHRLADAMVSSGLSPTSLREATRPPTDIAVYLELHIEQGPVLESVGIDIGVVSAVNGVEATEYVLSGSARHAGTTPMDARKDAGKGACSAITSAFSMFSKLASPDDRLTFGAIEFLPGARNVVPASARIVSEVRSNTVESIAALRSIVNTSMNVACESEGLTLRSRLLDNDSPAAMNAQLIGMIEQSCTIQGYTYKTMSSGAGHDAQAFAPYIPTGMIFVPSKDGISHHPDEHTDPEHISAGASVLMNTILQVLNAHSEFSRI